MRWLLLLISLSASAQLPVVPFTVPVASGVPGPDTVSGLQFRWVASDLTVGAKVTNWVDRVQSAVWTNGASSLQPTNSASGVCFDGSTVLTNAVITFTTAAKPVIWIVAKNMRNNNNFDSFLTSPSGLSPGIEFSATFVADPNSLTHWFAAITNVYQDWYVPGNGSAFSGVPLWYTNNVSTTHNSGLIASGTANIFNFAGQQAGGTKGYFYVQEIAVYTNDLSSANRTTLHTYATNTYAFSP